jgi:hypothetical protein
MSVPNNDLPELPVFAAPLEFSRDELRAIEHRRKLELGEQDEVFGTVFSQSAHFSYFPLARVQGAEWVRKNAWGEIAIDAGRIAAPGGSKRTGVPFGGLPRLLMAYITTEARRVNTAGGDPSRLDLTESLNAMVRELGLAEGSRNRAVMEALESALSARVTFTRDEAGERDGQRGQWLHTVWVPQIATSLKLWVPTQQPLDGFEPYITLSSEFLAMALDDTRVLPTRLDMLAQLAGKPMAYDVLLWLQNVVYALNRGNLPERFFSWPELFATTTHEYARVDSFVTYWKRALTEALRYYQDARVELVRGARGRPGGVIVKRSPLLVQPKRGALGH